MLASILFKPDGSSISVIFLHHPKAPLPISVTVSGITMFSRLPQLLNASTPIVVSPFGSSMLLRLPQPENAKFPITFTDSGISTVSILSQ